MGIGAKLLRWRLLSRQRLDCSLSVSHKEEAAKDEHSRIIGAICKHCLYSGLNIAWSSTLHSLHREGCRLVVCICSRITLPKGIEILLEPLHLLEARMFRVLHGVDAFNALVLLENLEDVFDFLADRGAKD